MDKQTKISVDDIIYIEENCRSKPFSAKLFSIKDDEGKEYTLDDIGGYTDPYVEKHHDTDEIAANLSKSVKHITSWLSEINDAVELDLIREVAEQMDLPASKLKVIQAKIPNRNLLDTDEE